MRSTEQIDGFPESSFKQMKGFLQNKQFYEIHLCDFFVKNQAHKGLLVPTGNPQQATH